MANIEQITQLPPNFPQFAAEVADTLAALYGPAAGREYLQNASPQFAQTLTHPAVHVYALGETSEPVALLMTIRHGAHVTMPFAHVLTPYRHEDYDEKLIRHAVEATRAAGADAIIAEFTDGGLSNSARAFKELGFEHVERMIMGCDLRSRAAPHEETATIPLTSSETARAARTLHAAYADHPAKRLHLEVRSEHQCRSFIDSVREGKFGAFEPPFGRIVEIEGQVAGLGLGTRIAPSVGFVLHLAVQPAYQNLGYGGALLQGLAGAFVEAGYERMALGVTRANPAVKLYRRLGFEELAAVSAYTWWR